MKSVNLANSAYSLLGIRIIKVTVKGACTLFRVHGHRKLAALSMESAELITEKEVPGASLNSRRPEQLKVPELKLWLNCRGAPTKGKRQNLLRGSAIPS